MDDEERSNRIKWFWADPAATIYAGKHVFSPRIDNLDDDPTGIYEFTARRTNARRYNAGRNEWDALGTHVDGDDQDFRGLSPRSKHWIDGNPPAQPCGLVQHHAQGIQVGSRERDMISHRSLGIELAATLRPLGNVNCGLETGMLVRRPWSHGIDLACSQRDAGLQRSEGIALGCVTHGVRGKPERSRQGIALGCVTHGVRGKPERSRQGIEHADWVRIPDGPGYHYLLGLEIGDGVREVEGLGHNYLRGLEIAADVRDIDGPGHHFAEKLELGCTVRSLGSPGTCDDATGVLHGYTSFWWVDAELGSYWFRLTIDDAGEFHVRKTVTSGLPIAFKCYLGSSCADKALAFALGTATDCGSAIAAAGDTLFIWVIAPVSGVSYFDVETGAGGCS